MVERPELKVTVFSDYICPFCYVGHARLMRLGEEWNLRVNWCFIELHPETPAAGQPVAALGYPDAQWSRMQENLQRMADTDGLPVSDPGFTTNSRRALLLAEAAKSLGRERFYRLHEALYRAYFVAGRNIGDPDVLRGIAVSVGVPESLVEAAWSEPRYPEHLAHYRELAARAALSGVPTYLFGPRKITGAVPVARLREAALDLADPA
jgi:predicted DsbA family dithiol-disulfide isomerase